MTFNQMLKELQTEYPEIELSFGYLGNVGKGYGTYNDLSWYFFTKVWDHRPGHSRWGNCHSFGLGLTPRKNDIEQDQGSLKETKRDIIGWIEGTVEKDIGKPCTR